MSGKTVITLVGLFFLAVAIGGNIFICLSEKRFFWAIIAFLLFVFILSTAAFVAGVRL